jgi:hypothetical protein
MLGVFLEYQGIRIEAAGNEAMHAVGKHAEG